MGGNGWSGGVLVICDDPSPSDLPTISSGEVAIQFLCISSAYVLDSSSISSPAFLGFQTMRIALKRIASHHRLQSRRQEHDVYTLNL